MAAVALHIDFCTKCHHSLSIPPYCPVYPTNGERAFSTPSGTLQNAQLITDAQASLIAIKETYTQLQESLVAIKETHIHLQESMEQLEEHRKRLEAYVDQQKRYFLPSPIRQLPTEILSLVFSYACQSFEREFYRTPLSISVTCYKWRNIAISTPALWTNIFVGSVGGNSEGKEQLSLYMERANKLPISLKWMADKNEWLDENGERVTENPRRNTQQEEHDALVAEVLRTRESWRTVEFYDITGVDAEAFFTVADDTKNSPQLPLLEDLIWRGCDLTDVSPGIPTAFTSACKLRTLHLCRGDFVSWADDFSWDKIDSITLDYWDSKMARALLHRGFVAGNKKTLILDALVYVISSPSPPVVYVTRLVLQSSSFTDTASLVVILSGIQLSSLEELTWDDRETVEACVSRHPEYIDAFKGVMELLKNSACSLCVLKLVYSNVKLLELPEDESPVSSDATPVEAPTWKYLLECLEHVPSIQSLTIVESPLRPPLLTSSFISAINSPQFLPALKSVELVWRDSDSLPEDEVVGFLESRSGKEGLAKLDSIVLGVREGGEVQPRVLASMKTLRNHGVQTSLW